MTARFTWLKLNLLFIVSLIYLSPVLDGASIDETLYLNTAGLAATNSQYTLDFILSGTAGNTIIISNPNFGTGNLQPGQPTTLTLTSSLSTFGQEATWVFSPGSSASFSLSSTDIGPRPTFIPDVFHILLQDAAGNPLPTNDPDYSSLLALNLTGGTDTPVLFTGTAPPINGIGFTTSGSTGSTGGGTSVPEPMSAGTLATGGTAAALLGVLRRKRQS